MDEQKLDDEILLAAYRYHNLEKFDSPEVQLMDKYPMDIVLKRMEHLIADGFLEYSVAKRNAWPTPKGLVRLGYS